MSPPSYDVSEVDQLAERIIALHSKKQSRVLVGIFGVPGSGKTTISGVLCKQLNNKGVRASILSQDGFHLYRDQLLQMPDPRQAVARRGSPYTFDPAGFLAVVQKLADAAHNDVVLAPSFDHAVKDPVPDDVAIGPDVEVVILEGNYLGLRDRIWCDIRGYLDELWFLDTPLTVAERRLVRRHLESGIVTSEKAALDRANANDLVNGRYILSNSVEPEVIIVTPEEH